MRPSFDLAEDEERLTPTGLALRCDDPKLGEVDRGRPLADQLVAPPVEHQGRLLGLGLDRHEAQARARHRLTTGLGIGRVVLVGLDARLAPSADRRGRRGAARLDVLRWHQACVVPEPDQLARPVTRPAAGLEADHAARQIDKEFQYFAVHQALAEHHSAPLIDTVHLEHALGDLQPDRDRLHLGRLPAFVVVSDFHLGTSMPSAGGVHLIRGSWDSIRPPEIARAESHDRMDQAGTLPPKDEQRVKIRRSHRSATGKVPSADGARRPAPSVWGAQRHDRRCGARPGGWLAASGARKRGPWQAGCRERRPEARGLARGLPQAPPVSAGPDGRVPQAAPVSGGPGRQAAASAARSARPSGRVPQARGLTGGFRKRRLAAQGLAGGLPQAAPANRAGLAAGRKRRPKPRSLCGRGPQATPKSRNPSRQDR